MGIQSYLDMLPLPTSGTELTMGYFPSAFLMFGGLVALVIAWNYIIYEGFGARYRLSVLLGTLYAVLMAVYIGVQYAVGDWVGLNILLFGTLTFALGFRFFLRYNVAFTMGLLSFLIIYYGIYVLAYGLVDIMTTVGVIGVAFSIAVLIYALFHFVEKGVEVAASILNAWPILAVLGTACIAEGILQLMGMSFFTMF